MTKKKGPKAGPRPDPPLPAELSADSRRSEILASGEISRDLRARREISELGEMPDGGVRFLTRLRGNFANFPARWDPQNRHVPIGKRVF